MANGESVADTVRTVCQAHWTAPATLAHHPARLARRTAQFGQAGTGGPRYRLFSPRSSGRRPLALLCPPKHPTSHAFRLPNEQAQEASQLRPAPPAWLDELGPGSLSWCVWGRTCRDPDSQDEIYHAPPSTLLFDGVIVHLFTLLFSLYTHNVAPGSQKNNLTLLFCSVSV